MQGRLPTPPCRACVSAHPVSFRGDSCVEKWVVDETLGGGGVVCVRVSTRGKMRRRPTRAVNRRVIRHPVCVSLSLNAHTASHPRAQSERQSDGGIGRVAVHGGGYAGGVLAWRRRACRGVRRRQREASGRPPAHKALTPKIEMDRKSKKGEESKKKKRKTARSLKTKY